MNSVNINKFDLFFNKAMDLRDKTMQEDMKNRVYIDRKIIDFVDADELKDALTVLPEDNLDDLMYEAKNMAKQELHRYIADAVNSVDLDYYSGRYDFYKLIVEIIESLLKEY